VICKPGGEVDGRWAVRPANYGDRRRLREIKAERPCAEQGAKNAKLCRSPEQEGLWFCEQRAKVGHCSYSKKYQRREDARLYSKVEVAKQATVLKEPREGDVYENSAKSNWHEQQRLILLGNSEVEQKHANEDHQSLLPREC
jgi:hypothetical protein